MNEIWKPVEGYEGIYEVGSFGHVRSLTRKVHNYTKPGRVLIPGDNGHSYCTVKLSKDGTKKHTYVHILVAKAFVDNPNGYTEVNHKDFNKRNNRADNLEWVSHAQNICHYRESKYGKAVEKDRQGTIRGKWVARVLKHKDAIISSYAKGEPILEVSTRLKLDKEFVSDVLRLYSVIPSKIPSAHFSFEGKDDA